MLDRSVKVFLDDLLEFVEDGKVVPIIGEELLRVGQNRDCLLYTSDAADE